MVGLSRHRNEISEASNQVLPFEYREMPLAEARHLATDAAEKETRSALETRFKTKHFRNLNLVSTIRSLPVQTILVPVYKAAYTIRGTTYPVVINAQSGRVEGDRPTDYAKVGVGALLAPLAIFGYIGQETFGLKRHKPKARKPSRSFLN
jgi:hypothetical protein